MTPEGDRSLGEQFNTWKDVVIPGLEADWYFWSGYQREDPRERPFLAYFRGTILNKYGSGWKFGIDICI